LLAELAEQGDVQTEASANLARALSELWMRMTEMLDFGFVKSPMLTLVSDVIKWTMIGLVLVGTAWLLFRLTRYVLGRRLPQPTAPALVVDALPETPDPQAKLRAALEAGDARAALAALWQGVTLQLAQAGVGRAGDDRTCREFVRSVRESHPGWAGLTALRGLARTVERLAYDEVEPSVADVLALIPAAQSLQPLSPAPAV
jgi:hypothetical protein